MLFAPCHPLQRAKCGPQRMALRLQLSCAMNRLTRGKLSRSAFNDTQKKNAFGDVLLVPPPPAPTTINYK